MKYFASILLVLVILILVTYAFIKIRQTYNLRTQNMQYGKIIQFRENEVLQFPDFSIRYLGKTSQNVDSNPNLTFTYYNFVVTALDNKERTLRWSSGTGDIAPIDFAVGNTVYQLELKYSEKDNKQLADYEMIISISENDISDNLFRLVATLSLHLSEYDLETLTKTLGFSFQEEPSNSNHSTIFLTSIGFSPIKHAGLRIRRNKTQDKFLKLEIDKVTNISSKTILERYPKAQPNFHEPNDPRYKSFSVPESWGTLTFGFDRNDVLISIIFDAMNLNYNVHPDDLLLPGYL